MSGATDAYDSRTSPSARAGAQRSAEAVATAARTSSPVRRSGGGIPPAEPPPAGARAPPEGATRAPRAVRAPRRGGGGGRLPRGSGGGGADRVLLPRLIVRGGRGKGAPAVQPGGVGVPRPGERRGVDALVLRQHRFDLLVPRPPVAAAH